MRSHRTVGTGDKGKGPGIAKRPIAKGFERFRETALPGQHREKPFLGEPLVGEDWQVAVQVGDIVSAPRWVSDDQAGRLWRLPASEVASVDFPVVIAIAVGGR